MRGLIGILFIVGGILLGLWLGLWVCFIGGIVQIVEACKADPVSAFGIAFGVVRILIASLVGWITFLVCAVIGAACLID